MSGDTDVSPPALPDPGFDASGSGTDLAPNVDPRIAAFSGALSGALAVLATHPLDVVRTKLAVERTVRGAAPPRYKGTIGTLRVVFNEQGAPGLFRGITPAILSHAPAAAVFFSTYSTVKTHGADLLVPFLHPSHIDPVTSSLGAGLGWTMTCVLLNPLFVLKTKQQTQTVARPGAPVKYKGLVSSLRIVFREQGLRGLYAGVVAGMAGTPGAMIQMPLYEYLKRYNLDDKNQKPSPSRVACASATASCCVGVVMYPMEVVRLRLQAQGGVGIRQRVSPDKSNNNNSSGGTTSSSTTDAARQNGNFNQSFTRNNRLYQHHYQHHQQQQQHHHQHLQPSTSPSTGGIPATATPTSSSSSSSSSTSASAHATTSHASPSAPPPPSSSVSVSTSPAHSAHSGHHATAAATGEYKGIVDCFRKIFAQEGMRSFYKGMGSSIIRTVPQSAIGLSCYETILRMTTYFLHWYNTETQV